jgi:hypothetical protein
MADTPNPQSGKTLEMRVAELEDKLAQTQITADDIKAFQKVSAAMAAQAGTSAASGSVASGQPCIANQTATPALSPQVCIINNPIFHCIISPIFHCLIHPIINPIIRQDCTCGPCAQVTTQATAPVQQDFEDLGS